MSFIHAQYCSFYSCPILFYFVSFNYWNQHFFVSKREAHLEPFSEPFKYLRWSNCLNNQQLLDVWQDSDIREPAEMTWRLAEHEGRGPGAKAGGCINLIAAVTVTHCNFAFIHSSYSECIHKYRKAKYIVCLIHFYVVTVMYTLMAIQKSRHRHLGINIVIRISISIVIAKKLFLP